MWFNLTMQCVYIYIHTYIYTDIYTYICIHIYACVTNTIHCGVRHTVLKLCVSRKVSSNIKSTGIQFVVQYTICPGITFGLLTILLRFWMNICSCWLDVMFQPRSSVWVTRMRLGLMINACFWPQAGGLSSVDHWYDSGSLERVCSLSSVSYWNLLGGPASV